RQMRITSIERAVQLREKEPVLADHAANAQDHVAQRRGHALAMDFGVVGQHLAQQGGPRSGQPGNADECWVGHGFSSKRRGPENNSLPWKLRGVIAGLRPESTCIDTVAPRTPES